MVAKMVASFESKSTASRRTTEAKQAGLQQMAAAAEEQRRQNQVKAMAAQAPWQTGASGSSDIASAPWRQEENREAQQRDPRTNRERRHKKPIGPYQPQQPRVLVAPKGSVTGSVASYVPVPPPPVPPPPSQAGPSSSSAGSGPFRSHGLLEECDVCGAVLTSPCGIICYTGYLQDGTPQERSCSELGCAACTPGYCLRHFRHVSQADEAEQEGRPDNTVAQVSARPGSYEISGNPNFLAVPLAVPKPSSSASAPSSGDAGNSTTQ